ncbi:MAG: GreA/GreB family elongation factor [Myxococcota bacterium]|nr:GreA/GreB family elongation factor [Myxococcota bacterium]
MSSRSLERKKHFIDELKALFSESISAARLAEVNAGQMSENMRSEASSRGDAKAAVESGRMAVAHGQRRERTKQDVDRLIAFATRGLKTFPRDAAIELGAMVDVRVEELESGAVEERTFFILPVGAGTDLEGPGGDGFLSVITPESPVGRSLMGRRVGDSFDTEIKGIEREWTVTDLV